MNTPGEVHWMTAYEDAFKRANGTPATVVICGNGWYRIAHNAGATNQRVRKGDVIAMTARLEQRADEQEAA